MPDYPIYCINLEHRQDRKEHSLKQFAKLGISSDTVIYPHFVKDKRGGVYGCFDSHMKIWKDFYTNYPDAKYVLIFEDDFVVSDKTVEMINNAAKFIDDNYNAVDVLLLHNHFHYFDNKQNDLRFANGVGLTTAAGFVSRRYIQSILDKYGKFPEPTGRQYDYEMNANIFDTDVMIYTDNIFYTREPCIMQLEDESDNYVNTLDSLYRKIMNIEKQSDILLSIMYHLPLTRKDKAIIGYIVNNLLSHQKQRPFTEQVKVVLQNIIRVLTQSQ